MTNQYRLTSLSNNATQQLTNDSTVCHPILLSQGATSLNGLCDDTPSARAVAGTILSVHVLLVIVSLTGLYYKLKKLSAINDEKKVNYLSVARNPALITLTLLVGLFLNAVMNGRVLIGRKIELDEFPEGVSTVGSDISNISHASSSGGGGVTSDILLLDSPRQQQHVWMELNSSNNHNIQTSSNVTNSAIHNSPNLAHSTLDSSTTVTIAESVQQQQQQYRIGRMESSFERFEKEKLLKWYKLLISSKFVILSYCAVLILHSTIFLICGIVDYFNWQYYLDHPDEKRSSILFVVNSFLFSPSGCGNSTGNLLVFVSNIVVYGPSAVIFIIWSLLTRKKDIWRVRLEVVLISVNWVFALITYALPSFIQIIDILVDYYVPWISFIFIACIIDCFVACTLPVFFYQKITPSSLHERKINKQEYGNDIQKCLRDPKWNSLFLQFTQSSFAPENVMCWNSIQRFKTVPEKTRKDLLRVIADTYLREGAPLELNVARKVFNNFEEIFNLLKEEGEATTMTCNRRERETGKTMEFLTPRRRSMKITMSIPHDILDKVEKICEMNMMDNFDQFYVIHYKALTLELGIS
ncbi:hypothetical protein C9374_001237 [Naegleria lovaniensis]|uniref:RGS domain-containing protein n=1 Tax=Naegleria lovaniensis TaxID=51637 RepID=A0AA88GXS4_NAELO|nr:uncharacterized protein C9374_001237 [Naegleria lovaniensis]KAG2387643.1 hypothetical protein C9374_001237 [Naegleria lovaniensis]